MKALYLGWLGAHNVGDDIMFENFKRVINEQSNEEWEVTPLFPSEEENNFAKYDLVCIGGGSILLEGYIGVLYRALEQGKKVMVWGAGYDDLMGEDFISRIEKSNIPPYIYSDACEEKLNHLAKKVVFWGVRGPLTYRILEKSNIDINKVVISGDPGLLLKKDVLQEKGTNLNFIKADRVVAINFGTSFNKIYGGKEELVEEALIGTCKKLLNDGYKIYLYPMCPADLDSILSMYKKLSKTDNIILDIVVHSGGELASILSNCVFSINFKLHGNVISAVAKIPFICLGYRLKAYDFMKSIECEELNIPTDAQNMQQEIEKRIEIIQRNEKQIIEKIEKNINKYIKILESAFRHQ